jgi:hypothetical protein
MKKAYFGPDMVKAWTIWVKRYKFFDRNFACPRDGKTFGWKAVLQKMWAV